MAKTSIKGVFENVERRAKDKVQENLENMLPMMSFLMYEYAKEEMKKLKKSSMTGNYINSFGIALYRDGKFVAVSTTNEEEGQEPIQMTLAAGDVFEAKSRRYDGKMQFHDFTASEGKRHFFANREVLSWLARFPPTKKKGFAFRVVSVVDYADAIGGSQVLLRLADDIENSGGIVSEMRL